MNTEAVFVPGEHVHHEAMSLSSGIAAIELLPTENGFGTLGLLSQLPAGVILQICGAGFNERTVKVRVNGQYYFVFLQDIESSQAIFARFHRREQAIA